MDSFIISVESGDTLYALAAKHGTTVDALVEANNISDPNLIFIGQDLHIPTESPQHTTELSHSSPEFIQQNTTITVTSGDTLSKIANDYGTTVDFLAQVNGIVDPNLIVVGQELVIPVETDRVSSDIQTHSEDASSSGYATSSPTETHQEPKDDLPSVPSLSPEWLEANIEVPGSNSSAETGSSTPNFSPQWLEKNIEPDSPDTPSTNQRFNDITGDQSDIHGVDLSSNPEADALYGYIGEDGEGAWTAGTGVVDWENSDPDGWLSGFEILTAEGKGNIIGTFEQDDFWGADFDAQVLEADFNISGHGLNVGYLNADGNYGGDPDGFGLMLNANLADAQYSNGAPSATNSNDIGFNFGLSVGAGAGFNFVYSDPDDDGISNLGFDLSAGPVDFGITSEYVGKKAESGLESAGNYIIDKVYQIDDAFDTVSNLLTGGGLFG